ncbi:MAG: glycine cleavage system protein GcvH [Armatimonadetes bacterium]|nr:glycine cleavage system protein GcvH [Armatimonadota bacterium]
MLVPTDHRFLPSHEWCRVDGDQATFGISDFAQDQLGDVVYIELPAVGSAVVAGEAFGTIESVKAASDLIAPLSGAVTAVNADLDAAPETVNTDPYGAGWLITIAVTDAAEADSLLDADAYTAHCEAGGH